MGGLTRLLGLAGGVSPWLLLGLFVAGLGVGTAGCWYVQEQRYDRAVAERDSAQDQLSVASNDAKRWRAAAEVANTAVQIQNANVEAARVDLAATEKRLREATDISRTEAASLAAQISKLKERARDNPDQTCRLGPLDRDAVRLLVGP